ncbi:MAG: CPBP family intramembrane metalloprotease [Clostridia bacterium]|nr:CPBP family intramembrane metalloprotease [Clostridia bacterium]
MYYQNKNQQVEEPFDLKQGGISFSFLMAFYVIITFFVQTILLLVTENTSVLYLAVCSTLSSLAIAGVIVYQCHFKKRTLKVLSVNKFSVKALIPTLLLCLGMFLGLGFVNIKFSEIMAGLGVNISQPTIPLNNIWQFLLFTLTLAVLPAIFEELFFRGLLLNSLQEHGTITKVVAVGICFALYHCNLGQFVYQFTYGVAFCLLALYAKSTLPCIIAHFINNFAIILFEYLGIYIDLFNPILIAIGLVALAGFFVFICVFNKKKDSEGKKQKAITDFYVLYGLLGIFICVLMIATSLFM